MSETQEKQQTANFKILVADDDNAGARRLLEFLKEKNFAADHAPSGKVVKEFVKNWRPHFVICDLTLIDFNAIQLLKWLNSSEFTGTKPKILVTSAHNTVQNIKECIKAGANDYIVKPFNFDDLLTRLVFHIQNKRDVAASENKTEVKLEGADVYLHLLDILLRETLSGREKDEVLLNITKMVGIALRAVRCSIVKISDDLQEGEVMASSDNNKGAKGLKLQMVKYPEMVHVMNTAKSVVIEDLAYDPMLAKIKEFVKGISFNSMIVCPVMCDGEMFGVLSARMDRDHSKFNDRDIRFIQLAAQITSLFMNSGGSFPHELLIEPTTAAA